MEKGSRGGEGVGDNCGGGDCYCEWWSRQGSLGH